MRFLRLVLIQGCNAIPTPFFTHHYVQASGVPTLFSGLGLGWGTHTILPRVHLTALAIMKQTCVMLY